LFLLTVQTKFQLTYLNCKSAQKSGNLPRQQFTYNNCKYSGMIHIILIVSARSFA